MSLLEFDLPSGGAVLVEAEAPTGGPVTRGVFGAEQVVKAAETLDDVLGRLRTLVEGIGAQLSAASSSADEFEVEFAVKLSADAGFVIVRTGGEANFRVAMRWTRSGSLTS
jgi:hypothetical protein